MRNWARELRARAEEDQVGADADITVFDPAQVIDRATYERPDQTPEDIVHVLVNGTSVVRAPVISPY